MEIFINKSKIQNDKDNVGVWVCWDFEDNSGYDVYVAYLDDRTTKYPDYFELIANKVPDLEKAEHIAKVFSHDNGLIYRGDVSPKNKV